MTTPFSQKRTSVLARAAAVVLALAVVAPLGVTSVDARAGGGSSFGSRGTRTFSAPPSTATAPRPATPFQRTETPSVGAPSSGIGGALGQPRRFGFGTGLAAGLLGAGVLGMLTGQGFFGGLGGLASMFGLLLQIGLIVLVIRFALNYFRGRNRGPAYAGSSPGPTPRSPLGGIGGLGGGLGSALGGLGGGARSGAAADLAIGQQDFAAFERMLSDVQYAYSREDTTALARLTTPEMLRYLGQDLEENRRQGVRNTLDNPHLIQGDLAEAWREGPVDYATVAMRFASRDTMVDRTSGRLVSGDPNREIEATELWTFRRDPGADWRLSAIQQTN